MILAASVLVIAAVAIGCGGDGDGGAAATTEVEIVEFAFEPPTITVEAGAEVSWANADEAAHTASAEDGSFDTGGLGKNEVGRVTIDEPGTYAYVCEFHPFMKGTIEVE
ncbi:MAG: cupredoxin domain-containing protein [Solirubrobacterales bacterium]